MRKLNLLPLEALVKTGDVDYADWNYRPVLGWIQKVRFHLIRQLLGERRGEHLLEIGYGSGVFLPELTLYADKLYGVDSHDKNESVREKLAEFDINAELVSGGAEKMDWPDDLFDVAVAVSALEFVDDLDEVCREVGRVLKPHGSFLVVTPGKSPILDLGLKVLTGKNAKDDFAGRREKVLPALQKHFAVKNELSFPKYGSSILQLYTALDLQPKKSDLTKKNQL